MSQEQNTQKGEVRNISPQSDQPKTVSVQTWPGFGGSIPREK